MRKGSKHTIESINQMKNSLKGRLVWNKGLKGATTGSSTSFKKGHIPWHSGKKNIYSKETIEKMRIKKIGYIPYNKGIPCREETKQKLKEKNMSEYKKKKLWVLSDVEDLAKNLAKKLAKEDKIKIGPWITRLILNKKDTESLVDMAFTEISPDDNKIIKRLDKITMEIHDIHVQLATLTFKVNPLPKKTIFDKFFS